MKTSFAELLGRTNKPSHTPRRLCSKMVFGTRKSKSCSNSNVLPGLWLLAASLPVLSIQLDSSYCTFDIKVNSIWLVNTSDELRQTFGTFSEAFLWHVKSVLSA